MDQDNNVAQPHSTQLPNKAQPLEKTASSEASSTQDKGSSNSSAPKVKSTRGRKKSKGPRKSRKIEINYAELLEKFKETCAREEEQRRKEKQARDANPELTPDHKIHYVENLEAELDKLQDGEFPENWHIDVLEQLDDLIGSEERMVMEQGGYDEGWYWDNDLNLTPEKEIKLATLLEASTLPYAKAYTAKRAKVFLEYKERQRRKAAGVLTEEELQQDLIEEQYKASEDPNDEFHYYGYHSWNLSHIAWPADLRRIDYGLAHDMAEAAVTAHVDVFYLRKVVDGKDMFLNWLDTVDFIGIVPTQGFKFHKSGAMTFCKTSTQSSLIGCSYKWVDAVSFAQSVQFKAYPEVQSEPLTKDNAPVSYKQRMALRDEQEAQDIERELKHLASITTLFSQAPRFDDETYRHGKPFMLRHVSWQWPYLRPYNKEASYELDKVQDGFYCTHQGSPNVQEPSPLLSPVPSSHIDQAGFHVEQASDEEQLVVCGDGVKPIPTSELIDSGSAAVKMSAPMAEGQLGLKDRAPELKQAKKFQVSAKAVAKEQTATSPEPAASNPLDELRAQLKAMFVGKEPKITTYEELRQIFLMCAKDLACVLDSVSERLLYKYCKVVSADSDVFYVLVCFNSQGVITKVTTEQVSYKAQSFLKNLGVLLGFKIAPKLLRPTQASQVSSEAAKEQSASSVSGTNPPDMQQVLKDANTLVQSQEQLNSIVANFLAAKQAQQAQEEEQLKHKAEHSAANVATTTTVATVAPPIAEAVISHMETPAPQASGTLLDGLGPEFEDASLLLQAQRPNLDEKELGWNCFGRVEVPQGLVDMPVQVVDEEMPFAQLIQRLLGRHKLTLEAVLERRGQKICLISGSPLSEIEVVVHYESMGRIAKVTCKGFPHIAKHLRSILVGKYLVEDGSGICAVKPCTGKEE